MKGWLWMALLLGLMSSVASAQEDWQYTLRPGDSLWKICDRFAQQPDACWRELASYNGLDNPHSIRPGDTLRVPIDWLKEKPISATVRGVTGEVLLYPAAGGEPVVVTEGQTVAFGDALETGMDGSAKVHFADQSVVRIKPSSLLVVNQYRRFLGQKGERTELRLERGAIRNSVSPQDQDEATFEVYTPGVVAAVRGTEYYLTVDGAETSRNEVLEGQVDVSGRKTTREVMAGYATLAAVDEPPIEPVALLPAPSLAVTESPTGADAVWPAQADAQQYVVEWYQQPDDTLLGQQFVSETRWQQNLPVGEYRLLVRAVDANGLRGEEAWQAISITPPPLAAPAPTPEPELEPEPQPEPEKKQSWDLWVFIGGVALMLAL
ncbi:FecR domain-containing protein [Alcanivorax sediminis]|uniref:LysM peptidoglycan-binding domain-containing protein n=1 Tax=Alcanivorax sediminis TaxID=2663008 RepID=A0A6N7LQC4_9GAMM|nr:FecR domain-containing protein [Alcanivorax sediminis]MQX52467.1 LysM peptidoglycan-binding domain-containing protein [Alcanivorax sediminis]